MRKYEAMFVFDPREEPESMKDYLKNLLQEKGGKILEEKDGGVRNLAYPIKKRERGFYYIINAELDPKNNESIKKELNIKESVLRYMFIVQES